MKQDGGRKQKICQQYKRRNINKSMFDGVVVDDKVEGAGEEEALE